MPVNGIELKEGQIWKTKNYGVVKLSESGVNADYPWRMNFPNNGDPIGSITTDGKYWEEDEIPELLECIYNPEDKGEKKPMKFNPTSESTKLFLPKPGDKIICNNGEEFICCTLEFLHETISTGIRSDKPILGYHKSEYDEGWQDWDEEALACPEEYGIREIIPQSLEAPADKKEEVKEDSLYTVDEVFDAIFETTKHLQIEIPWDYIDDVKEHLSRKNDPQYLEFLRLKAIYE